MNSGILLKNYKMCTRGNWGQSKDKTNMFEGDKNADAKKNKRTKVDFVYDSDNM